MKRRKTTDNDVRILSLAGKWLVMSPSIIYSRIYRIVVQLRLKRILDVCITHRRGTTESCFYVFTVTAAVSVALPDTGGNPSERPIYETMRKKYYWIYIANYVYTIVWDARDCVWNRPSEKQRRPLRLFPASGRCNLSEWTSWNHCGIQQTETSLY